MNFVFVIGAARSGTKFLRDLIGASQDAALVPYDVNYVWRTGNENYLDDALPIARARYVKNRIIAEILRQAHYNDSKSVVIEKTVSNCLRIPFIDQIFPNAKFIHLIRDGRDVVESSYRMWQEKPNWFYLINKAKTFPLANYRYAAWYLANFVSQSFHRHTSARIWGPRYPGMEVDMTERDLIEVCAKQWAICVESAMNDLAMLPPERVLTVRYEDLVCDFAVIDQVVDFAGVQDKPSVSNLYRKSVRRDTGTGWDRLPEPSKQAVINVIGPTLKTLGYGAR